MDNPNVIEIKNLKKYYGKSRGVEDVSFSIQKGTIYGFIGPNGAGKSTTIRAIIGLINKTSGQILINGKEVNKNDLYMKKIIGYLPSEVNFYGDMTVKQMFDYHASFFKKNTKDRREELVNLLKVDENKKISDLSLGNSKKVGIILALMHEPEILILDEPTSGLDPIMQKIFQDILLQEKNKGTTILYSSHVLSEVSSICDYVGFIKDGKIIKEDTVENIRKNSCTYLVISSSQIEKIKEELNLKIAKEEGNEVTFINTYSPNEVIKKLSKFKLDSLLIEEIPLEDLFIHYYS